MATKILSAVFPLFGCAHQFSWPRRWNDGEYYQVCVRCGSEFQYDWSTMERRQPRSTEITESGPARKPSRPAASWRPRARRLAVELPARFRLRGSKVWVMGTIRNVSRSGVLLESGSAPDSGAELVLIFEMPAEVSGQDGSRVLATGRVVRGHDDIVAVSLTDYHFLHQ